MKIASSQLQLEAASVRSQRHEINERLETWTGQRQQPRTEEQRRGPPLPRPQVTLSEQGLATQQAEASEEKGKGSPIDPKLEVLVSFIEKITGKKVRIYQLDEARTDSDPKLQAPPPEGRPGNGPRQADGPGFAYERHERYEEQEAVAFQAQGKVRTADGREIAFQVDFQMSRQFVEESRLSIEGGAPRMKDPLILDFAGSAQELGNMSFRFDLDADGQTDDVPLLAGGRGYLAFDRNDNGRIDDGRELFGPQSGDGFADLAQLDADRNGWIDENDPAWSQLRVWKPDAEGKGTLQTLAEADVGAVSVANVATGFDIKTADNTQLGRMRASGVYLRESGGVGTVSQVDLSV